MSPDSGYQQILAKNQIEPFHDIRYTANTPGNARVKDLSKYFAMVCQNQRYENYFYQRVKISQTNRAAKIGAGKDNLTIGTLGGTLDMHQAQLQLKEMSCHVSFLGMKSMVWYFNKLMRNSMQGLFVDKQSLNNVKQLVADGKRVVLMPIFKTFLDAFVMTYVNNHFGVEQPFMFGNYEDTPRLAIFDKWVSSVGYCRQRRNHNQSLQSRYINSAIIKEAIEDNSLTMVFQNSERPRTGKFHRRTNADLSVTWLLEAFLNMPVQSKHMVIVPVMTSYDRIFETYNLTSEMATGLKKDMRMRHFIKRHASMKTDVLGQVFVKYLAPISVQEFLQKNLDTELDVANLEKASILLTQELYNTQAHATPVTLNTIIAAILLKSRKKQMVMPELLEKAKIIYEYIKIKDKAPYQMEVPPQ